MIMVIGKKFFLILYLREIMNEFNSIESSECVLPEQPLTIFGTEGYETFLIGDTKIGIRPKWISVKTDTPKINKGNDESKDVLVYCDGKMYVAYLVYYGVSESRTEEEYIWYERGTGCGCCCSTPKPTHWMPLPLEPYSDDYLKCHTCSPEDHEGHLNAFCRCESRNIRIGKEQRAKGESAWRQRKENE